MKSFSILVKLMAHVLVIIAVTLIATYSYHYYDESKHSLDSITSKGSSMANNLSLSIADWMYQFRLDNMRKLLHSIESDPDIKEAHAISTDGYHLTGSDENNPLRNKLFSHQQWLQEARKNGEVIVKDKNRLNIVKAVTITNGDIIGFVSLKISLNSAYTALKNESLNALVVSLILFILAALATYFLARTFSAPLKQMLEAVHALRSGDLDRRTQIRRNDEIGKLSYAINEMAAARQAAEETLLLSANVFKMSAQGIVIINSRFTIIEVNEAFEEITGYTKNDATGLNFKNWNAFSQNQEILDDAWYRIENHKSWRGEAVFCRKDDSEVPLWMILSRVDNDSGQLTHFVCVFSDISQIKDSQEQLDHLAHHDALTDLPNRLLLDRRIWQGIRYANRNNCYLSLILFDLDNFKNINDSFGHGAGDLLLKKVSDKLIQLVDQDDTVARLGGDEFVILLRDDEEQAKTTQLLDSIFTHFEKPLKLDKYEIRITTSAGIAFFPINGKDPSTLLRNADTAMYLAKKEGRYTYRFYTEELTAKAIERVTLENNLRRAFANEEFYLLYQPQVNLHTGYIVGVESLIRWNSKELGVVQPDQFIYMAEECGLIHGISDWVLHEACSQYKLWLEKGYDFGSIAINIVKSHVQLSDFADKVADILHQTGLPASCLELEFTESVIMDKTDIAIMNLEKLRKLGVSLAIDDFGTGFSSLSQLKWLPIHKLKIDQSFIHDIDKDRDSLAIVDAVVAMGRRLGLTVIAEGVETETQAARLKRLGCTETQGYLYSKPVTAEQLENLFKQNSLKFSDEVKTDSDKPAPHIVGIQNN